MWILILFIIILTIGFSIIEREYIISTFKSKNKIEIFEIISYYIIILLICYYLMIGDYNGRL